MLRFRNRSDAGRQLALLLEKYRDQEVIVYGLPRGGIVVAAEIARYLHVPLEPLFAHKIGHPYQPEYAIAAISEGGHLVTSLRTLSPEEHQWLEKEKEKQLKIMQERKERYLQKGKKVSAHHKIAIIVDDGIATGLTLEAGIETLKGQKPTKIIVAVPIAPKSAADHLKKKVDAWVGNIIENFEFLGAIQAYYEEFHQVSDEEVLQLLKNF